MALFPDLETTRIASLLIRDLVSADAILVEDSFSSARSIRDLQNMVYDLDKRGVTLSATEQPIDTQTSARKWFLDMLGVFSEFETNLRKERQMEGIAKAKERGLYKGGKPSVDVEMVKELRDRGMGVSAIAKEMGIGRASVYRALGSQS
jgi:DNA invertase Pin-like site-specific DNA recombinase